MTEKIKWYQEVLELEPNSKVFFSLARLLATDNRPDEAADVLKHGLERHPEFLEARLFFIELLYKAGHRPACMEQVNKISRVFSGYTDFWQAWAACLSSLGGSRDVAAVLRLVAAHFKHNDLSLHEVLNCGIAAILNQLEPDTTAENAAFKTVTAPLPPEPSDSVDGGPELAAEQPVTPAETTPEIAVHPADAQLPAADAAAPPTKQKSPSASALPDNILLTEKMDITEERFSLRTRSMAEVLAEQGDIKSALDIYQELAASAVTREENADLNQRIATLNAKLGNAPTTDQTQSSDLSESSSGKDKLISMLEALAERVETRAQG
ncbi:hypothetical protein AGMMS49925_08870 [Deltaproteobacteria bacterium]|nr:hypothetical protein AGMMS49925_08870 [Deltaproteobacteria bacterium]